MLIKFLRHKMLHTVLFYGLILLAWAVVYIICVDFFGVWKSYAFPSPSGVLQSLVGLSIKGILAVGVQASFYRLLIGYSLSLVLGVGVGLIIAKFAFLDRNLRPLILGLQTLPSVCWVPFAILWFGLGNEAIVFIEVIGSTFAMALATIAGVRNIDPVFIKVSRTYGAKGFNLYAHVILPAAIPDLVTGMKQAWSFAWRGLMAGEMLVGTSGLGQILMMGRELADINQVAAMIVVILVIGICVERMFFGYFESRIRKRWGL